MAGQRTILHRRTRAAATRIACAAIVALGALAVSDGLARRWSPTPAKPGFGHDGPCPAKPNRLGAGRGATFVYRIQQPWDIELLAKMRAHRRASVPVRDRDVFLVRARGPEANRARTMINRLKNRKLLSGQLFHCSRIATLTGVRTDNAIWNEWIHNQAGSSRVWGIFPDWEKPLWHFSYPNRPRWSDDFGTNVRRIAARSAGIRDRGKHPGVVITGWRYRGPNAWNYGRLARRAHLDGQVIQTQGECQMSPDRFRHRASRLLEQYRNAGVGKSRLAMQVSFAGRPGSTPLPHDVTPRRAAACARTAYRAGVRTFLLWAYPAYLDSFFASLPDRIR